MVAFGPPCAHYPGDVADFVLGQLMGPTIVGARDAGWVCATSAEYDPAADRTTVTFSFVPPAAMAEAVLDRPVLRLPGRRVETPGEPS